MSDDPSIPEKIPFNRAEPDRQTVTFKQSGKTEQDLTNPDGSPLRDKDNAQPTLKPVHATRPAPTLAPAGAMGIRTGLGTGLTEPGLAEEIRFMPEYEQSGLGLDHGIEFEGSLYTEGRVLTMPGYDFLLRIGDEPRPDGIEGGKIDQLILKKDGATVARYNHGWEVEPTTAEQKEALHRIRIGLDDEPVKRISAPEQDKSKDHGIER